ncbi:MAG TPA: RidA family protein [Bryobacteraceae bacterium]|nr:RidA family protein [Bryobacteraceae bacterium]
MTERRRIGSGYPLEAEVGYSRVVRVGNRIYVAGTVASDDTGAVISPGDAYAQARYILQKIARALAEAGASMEHVVRTRMFVTDITRASEFGRAHGEVFREIRPAATMIEVKALVDPGFLIEIEIEAEL